MEVWGEVCVLDRSSERARMLSASPAARAGRHTWHHAQATLADVPLVTQLRVCAFPRLGHRHPPAHCEESDLGNDSPPCADKSA